MEQLKLPNNLSSPGDVSRLMRELDSLNDFFVGAAVRATGQSMQLPKLSGQLDWLARQNSLNLLEQDHRRRLMDALKQLQTSAPKLHISFAADASPQALEKILAWLRQNIHPQVLLEVGLQPAIAGGCVLRTTNKVFDMSLRTNLKRQSKQLMQMIKGAADGR